MDIVGHKDQQAVRPLTRAQLYSLNYDLKHSASLPFSLFLAHLSTEFALAPPRSGLLVEV